MIYHEEISVFFGDLINVNFEDNLEELMNDVIKTYNKAVDKIIQKIIGLEKWDDYIVFENKKYGYIHKTKNNIHIENNCMGDIIYVKQEKNECEGCRNPIMFNTPYTCNCRAYDITKCIKCGFMEKKIKFNFD